MILGSIWFETMSGECNQSMKHIWSVLLHNRWNVFVGAEEYVTWLVLFVKLDIIMMEQIFHCNVDIISIDFVSSSHITIITN